MGIKKQEFYEGAALHLVARSGLVAALRYEAPFFLFNDSLSVMLKYCTKGRSPWGFTFTADEQNALRARADAGRTAVGLVCGSDGVAAVDYDAYVRIAAPRNAAIHIACYRKHGEHYEVLGPDGPLGKKIPPSGWQRILRGGEANSESR